MKKTLFSLAFLAASGGYVAYANHGLDGLLPGSARPDETAVALAPSVAPALLGTAPDTAIALPSAAAIVPVAPAPVAIAKAPVVPVPAPVVSAPVLVATAPIVPVPAPVAPTSLMPPLPRPRPADIPTVETAQTAIVTPASATQYRDGTYTGTDENAYYGRVQVRITVAGSQITSIKPLDYPSDRRTSRYINGQALPLLQQEVMQAQSANVDTVSGATLTSNAYIKSLDNALSKAAGGNA